MLVPLALNVWAPALAAEPACAPERAPAAALETVKDAHTVRLSDGAVVRLVGALPPEAPPNWRGDDPWLPLAEASKALEAIAAGAGAAELAAARRSHDRRGRLLAQLFVSLEGKPVWVQGRLVEQGLARAYSLADASACARALQTLEAQARADGRGLWRWRQYGVVPATETRILLARRNTFQIVEGTVAAVSATRRWTFVNFDADWRRDFTIAIAAAHRRAFEGSDVDLEALEGRRVRARGWIESWNGPAIKVTHPEEIEVLPPD